MHSEPDGMAPLIGTYDTTLTRHFFESLAATAGICLHLDVAGRNPHHIVEAQFKAFARALRAAAAPDPRAPGDPQHQGRAVTATRPTVVVLDYGSGNLRSAQRALQRVGADAEVTADSGRRARGRRPGGARRRRVRRVHGRPARGARRPGHRRRLAGGRPVLGICVGMQVLFEAGVEHGVRTGAAAGGPASVERLHAPVLPHMGWNTVAAPGGLAAVRRARPGHPVLLRALLRRARPLPDAAVGSWLTPPLVTWATHGEPFVAAVENGPLCATQFHPEKSGDAGAALLANWLEMVR